MVVQDRIEPIDTPALSTFRNRDYFPPATLRELLTIRAAIDLEERLGADPLSVDLARVCLGSTVELASYLRRDGRALRHEPLKSPERPVAGFLRRAEEVESDLPRSPLGTLRRGHPSRHSNCPPGAVRHEGVDLVASSLPLIQMTSTTRRYTSSKLGSSATTPSPQISRRSVSGPFVAMRVLTLARATSTLLAICRAG